MTSNSCWATPISYKGGDSSRKSRVASEIWRGTDNRQAADDRRDDRKRRLSRCRDTVQIKTNNNAMGLSRWQTYSKIFRRHSQYVKHDRIVAFTLRLIHAQLILNPHNTDTKLIDNSASSTIHTQHQKQQTAELPAEHPTAASFQLYLQQQQLDSSWLAAAAASSELASSIQLTATVNNLGRRPATRRLQSVKAAVQLYCTVGLPPARPPTMRHKN